MLERTDPAGVSGTEQTVVGDSSPPPVAGEELSAGDAVGRYTILSEAGRGAMGVVYAAYDPQLDRRVALKILHKEGSDAQQRLVREARALASFVHANAVTVHDVGEAHGRGFIATEFIDGRTLREWLDEQPRSTEEILDVMRAAGRGLAAAHQAGIVHRDFKPQNVMVTFEDRVVVMDFGLARRGSDGPELDLGRARSVDASPGLTDTGEVSRSSELGRSAESDLQLTSPGAVMGTPAYMSLEQHRGQPASAASDQFSYCITLFEALTGRSPFKGRSRTSLAYSIAKGRREAWPGGRSIPSRVRRAVDRGLATQAADRWPDMDTLLDELEPPRAGRARPWLIGAGLLATVGGTAVGFQLAQPGPACVSEGSAALDEVWDPPRRERIETAFAATGLAYADETARRVLGKLDAYASEWKSGRQSACEDHQVTHRQTARIHELRVRCLDRGLAELDALSALLEQADAAMVRQASDAVAGLPDLARCEDVETLLDEVPLPDDQRLAEAVEQARRLLVDARARTATGDYEGASARIDEAAEHAPAGDDIYLPLTAELALERGQLLVHQGEFDEAAEQLQQAHLDARRAGHHRVALDAAVQLVYVVGYRLARYPEAELWGAIALAEADRLGPETAHHARILSSVGILHGRQGRFEMARDHYARAKALYEKLDATQAPGYTSIFTNLGLVSLNLGDADAADAYLTAGLERTRTRYGDGHPRVASCVLNLASTALKKGDSALALERAREARQIAESALGADHVTVGYAEEAVARAALAEGELDQAATSIERAAVLLEASLGAEHPAFCEVRVRQADILRLRDEPEVAEVHAREARAVLERRFGDADARTAEATAVLAMVQLALDERETARAQAERILELVPEGSPNGALPRARAMLVLARLDPETASAQGAQARKELASAGAEGAHLRRELDGLSDED